MQSIQPAWLGDEQFQRPRNTSGRGRLFGTGVLMIVIYWRNLTLLGGPQTLSGCLLLEPCSALEDKESHEPAGIPSHAWKGIGQCFEFWQPLHLCLGWAEACAFWRHFFVSAFTISSLKGRAGRGDSTRCGNQRDSSTPLTAFFPKKSQEHTKHRWCRDGGRVSVSGVIIDGGRESRPQLSPGAPNCICSARHCTAAGFGLFKQGKTNQES